MVKAKVVEKVVAPAKPVEMAETIPAIIDGMGKDPNVKDPKATVSIKDVLQRAVMHLENYQKAEKTPNQVRPVVLALMKDITAFLNK